METTPTPPRSILYRATFICLILVSLQAFTLTAQCDTKVAGILTYCGSFDSADLIDGYLVGFRAISLTGDTLDVVDLLGNNVTNRGKRINDINTTPEPFIINDLPLRISGVGADTIEYWYFGPYMNGDSFNIALVDPNNVCDTVFVASGYYDCADFTPASDPGACAPDPLTDPPVPLYFLDFSSSVFTFGGGGGGNENFDEVFLIMQRPRFDMCCDLPNSSRCFEFIVRLNEDDIGLAIDDVGSGSTGGSIYADSLNGFVCTGDLITTWPFIQVNGQNSDLPLCLPPVAARDFIVLSCKPGNNDTGASIDAISNIFAPPEATVEPCNVFLEVFNADSAFWSSSDDPNLDNLISCTGDSVVCSFFYDSALFGDVTACEGDTFTYIVGGSPDDNQCLALDTILYDTTYVVVFPVFTVEIDSMCNGSADSLILNAVVTSPAVGCQYDYNWSNGDSTSTITVPFSNTQYYVTVTRSDLPMTAQACVLAIDSVSAQGSFEIICDNITNQFFPCIGDIPPPDTSLVDFMGCGNLIPLVFVVDVPNNGTGCQLDTFELTRYYIVDIDGDTITTTTDRDTCIQLLSAADDILPVITSACPANITVSCASQVPPPDPGSVSATDNCDSVTVTHVGDVTTNQICVNQLTITRTYLATDLCGNSSSCTQIITVFDNIVPTITCPINVTVSCANNIPPPNTSTVTASDNCSGVPVVTFVSDVTTNQTCVNRFTLTRTYRATDACGNSATCAQIFTVNDQTPPSIVCPPPVTVTCIGQVPPVSIISVMANDNCGSVTVTQVSDNFSGFICANRVTITRFYQAVDACGNSASCSQIITVNDQTPPAITCPPPVTVTCASMIPAPNITSVMSSDNCGGSPTITFVSDVTTNQTCVNRYTITRTYRATDLCTNSATCTQTITVNDQTPPTITCPPPITASCANMVPTPDPGGISASDNCNGIPTVTFVSDVTTNQTCADRYTLTRTYRATDECGNSNTCAQTIIVNDLTPPSITCPPTVTVTCATNVPPANINEVTATDNCNGVVTITHLGDTISNQTCANRYTLTRTYRATDACGNSNTCTQMILVNDLTPPSITCPPDVSVTCTELIPPSDTTGVTATDSCTGVVTITFVGDVNTNQICANQYTVVRTYRATDECGNSSTCNQMIFVNDTIPPSITCPADLTVSCASEVPPMNTDSITASDNCVGVVDVVHLGDSISNQTCANQYTLTRTYQAIDVCGNSSSCNQVITVFDSIPPFIECPDDITINPESSTLPDVTGTAISTDSCGEIPILSSTDSITIGACVTDYFIHRTWRATDVCGNSSTCLQEIDVLGGCLVDLALDKNLALGQTMEINPGEDVNFTIRVSNNGNIAMSSVSVVDYIPVGFTLNDPDWTAGTDGSTGQSASIELSISNGYLAAGGLIPGGFVDINITLRADDNLTGGTYTNIAEISGMRNLDGVDVSESDFDSQPDTDDANDPPLEDDHDPVSVCLLIEPVVFGASVTCQDATSTYTVASFNPAHTYNWIVGAGGLITASTDSSITILWTAVAGTIINIILEESTGGTCVFIATFAVTIGGAEDIACFDHFNLSIANECGTQILSGMILAGVLHGDNSYLVYVIDMVTGDTIPNGIVDWTHVGMTLKVSVRSPCSGQSCWGLVTIEDKSPPILDCFCASGDTTQNCLISCVVVDQLINGIVPDSIRPIIVDDCGNTTLDLVNVDLTYADCSNGSVIISWLATDGFGNTATCVQEFDIIPLSLDSLDWPLDFTGNCDDSSHPDNTGWPQLDGLDLIDVVASCNIWTQFDDIVVPICGDGRKIIRRWTVTNMCNAQSATHIQTILLKDSVGPVLTCSPNITVSTDVWACDTDLNMPRPGAIDACSTVKTFKLFSTGGTVVEVGGQFRILNLPVGVHIARWVVTDECFNTSTCTIQITVQDNVPPVVSCQAHTVVSLTNDRPNGITFVPASAFDDGSFDNCSEVLFRARRMDSCIDFDWTTNGACIDDIPGGIPPVNVHDRGTDYGICIPVGCCDLGTPFMVQLEVRDLAGNINYCMVEVEVQDKLEPTITCPPTINISCDYDLEVQPGTYRDITGNSNGNLDEDPLSELFGNMYDAFRYNQGDRQHIIINDPGNPQFQQPHDWGLEGWAADNCEVDLSVVVTVLEDCSGQSFPGDPPAGAVKLIQRVFFAFDGTQSSSCMQRIWVIDYNQFFINDTNCDNEDPTDGIIWPCDVLVTTCPMEITNTGEPVIFDDGCSLIGVSFEDAQYDFAEGACYKILREWKIIDWCQFNLNTGYGLWSYTQTIKVADSDGAEFLDCPSGPVAFCLNDPGISLPANNQLFLGENNPNASSCSVHVNLHHTVRELCSTSVTYDVKLYLFNQQDFIQIKPETTVELDANHEADLYFDTQESGIPSIVLNGLPYTSALCEEFHRVLWSVEDGCGNRTFCDYLFRLEDCKQPTPVCIDGVSAAVMQPNGEVTILALNFNASSVDDCTPGNQLVFSFNDDFFLPSLTYTCDNVPVIGVPFEIEMWAADGGNDDNCNGIIEWSERNKDFCTASLIIQDPNDICDDDGLILVGEIMTDHLEAVSNVMVHLQGPQSNTPSFMTHDDGKYSFSDLMPGFDYDIRPERNDDPKNGVSTLDLVGIQKHLLGKEPFTKASQYIAADANSSGSVSAIDLIEIRKLILGLYDQFPSNQSWRFVKKENAEIPGPPWPLTENISIYSLQPNENKNFDFVGVKIGDVNGSAQAHLTQILPRNARLLMMVKALTHGEIREGEIIECKFIIPQLIGGFQWTLETDGLEYMGVKSTSIPIDDSHIGLLDNGIITMSWNGEPVSTSDQRELSFILKFRVTAAGELQEMLKMTDAVTAAEAYTIEGDLLDVKLEFDEDRAFTDFALYQNKPNPWDGQTLIEFDLPYDGLATMTVYDVAGKVVKSIEAMYKAGHHTIMLTSHDIPTPGVLYYRLDSGQYSAVRKMMIFH